VISKDVAAKRDTPIIDDYLEKGVEPEEITPVMCTEIARYMNYFNRPRLEEIAQQLGIGHGAVLQAVKSAGGKEKFEKKYLPDGLPSRDELKRQVATSLLRAILFVDTNAPIDYAAQQNAVPAKVIRSWTNRIRGEKEKGVVVFISSILDAESATKLQCFREKEKVSTARATQELRRSKANIEAQVPVLLALARNGTQLEFDAKVLTVCDDNDWILLWAYEGLQDTRPGVKSLTIRILEKTQCVIPRVVIEELMGIVIRGLGQYDHLAGRAAILLYRKGIVDCDIIAMLELAKKQDGQLTEEITALLPKPRES
jgi:hypothetical protein